MRCLRIALFFILSCSCLLLFAEEQKKDSLLYALSNAKHDTTRVKVLTVLFNYFFYDQPDLSYEYINDAINISGHLPDKKYKIDSYNNLAHWLRTRGRFDESIDIYLKCLAWAREINYEEGISESLQGIGNNYWRKADYANARKYHNENLEYCIGIGDRNGEASSYNNLGNLFVEEGEYAKALENFTHASKIYKEINDERDYAVTLGNIALAQAQLRNYEKAIQYNSESRKIAEKLNEIFMLSWLDKNLALEYKYLKKYDKALDRYENALMLYKKQGETYEVAQVMRLMGNVYVEMRQYQKALSNYYKSRALSYQLNDSAGIAFCSDRLSDLFSEQDRFAEALPYAKEAKEIGIRLKNPSIVMKAEANLASILEGMGRYREAYQSFFNYNQLKDSLQNEEKDKLAAEVEAKFQNERKENEIAALTAQNEINELRIKRRENERNYLMGISVLILILSVLAFRLYRIKLQSNRKLQELDKIKTRFFANISHEFRTPLTLILGTVEDDVSRQPSKKENKKTSIIKRNAYRLLNLVNQLLDLSRLETKSMKLRVTHLNIAEHLRTLEASFSSLAEKRHIKFRLLISGMKNEGYYDPENVEKIVYNLLFNAFKFTRDYGEITFNAFIEDKTITITVKDNGSGIAEDQLEKIFERFYQVENSYAASFQGTGIGLALVKELVELHHGKIDVESKINRGSSFTVTLPISGEAYHKSEIISEPQPGAEIKGYPSPGEMFDGDREEQYAGTEEKNESETVLIVEDNQDMRNYISRQLKNQYKIMTAANGEEGFRKALKTVPELIVTDLMMPGSGGVALCENIKSHTLLCHIPVIMLTAKADMDSKLEGLETGADDFLTKPFNGKELDVRIRNLINSRKKLREKYSHSIYLQPNEISITSKDEAFLKKAMEIVEKHMDNSDFSIDDFQKEIGFSRMQLHRKLKALTDSSATEFVRIQRLKRAAQFFAESDLNVSEVCYQVGFSNLSYFTRAFRAHFGMSPTEFITKNHKLEINS